MAGASDACWERGQSEHRLRAGGPHRWMIALPAPERYDALLGPAPLMPRPQDDERGEAIARVKTRPDGTESDDRVESFNRAITGWLSPQNPPPRM